MMSEHESDNESRFFLVWPVTNQRTESIKSEQDPSTRAILPSDSIQQPINSALPRYGHDFRQPFSASFPLNRHSITFHPTHFWFKIPFDFSVLFIVKWTDPGTSVWRPYPFLYSGDVLFVWILPDIHYGARWIDTEAEISSCISCRWGADEMLSSPISFDCLSFHEISMCVFLSARKECGDMELKCHVNVTAVVVETLNFQPIDPVSGKRTEHNAHGFVAAGLCNQSDWQTCKERHKKCRPGDVKMPSDSIQMVDDTPRTQNLLLANSGAGSNVSLTFG